MFFSTYTIFPLAILVATATADLHNSCTCLANNQYIAELTDAACSSYNAAGYPWGSTKYDSKTGRCTGVNGGRLAGDQWEGACQTLTQQMGWKCPSGKGRCYATVDQVRGSC